MQTNWKRGIVRLYLVLWPLWILVLLIRVASLPRILWGLQTMGLVVWGLVVPGLLFLGVIWVANGFLPGGKSGADRA